MSAEKESEIGTIRGVDAFGQPAVSKWERLIANAKGVAAAKTIVVYPCDETSLRGVVEAAEIGIISPILVGPVATINAVAHENKLDISKFEIVDVTDAENAAAKAVELIGEARGELLMKGSLHTDELMRAVTASKTGLRTSRRISHVFIMDVPRYAETLFITDAAINIFPDLDVKRDIIQNAIDLFTQVGLGTPGSPFFLPWKLLRPKFRRPSMPRRFARWPIAARLRVGSSTAHSHSITPSILRRQGSKVFSLP